MHGYLKRLVDERNSLAGLMQTLDDKAVTEDRSLTDPEQERMRGWQARAAELDTEITEQNEYLKGQRAWAVLQDQIQTTAAEPEPQRASVAVRERPGALQTRGADLQTRSWGQAFTESNAFQTYSGHGTSGIVEVSSVLETRAPIDTTFLTVPPALFTPAPWNMTTPLLDAIGHETISTGSVEWVVYPGSYPEAQVVAEGALKPEATITPTVETGALQTLAHHKGITRQALEDIPRIQQIVENALRGGVLVKLENNAATALTASTDIGVVDDQTDLMSGIRVALGNVQSAGYASANAVLLNPADFAALDIAVMGATVAGPALNNTFWGLRAIAAAAVPAGTAYVGDFRTGVTQFDRGATSVYLTDSHADYFLRNILVILAETRALTVITEPQALQKVTVAGGAAAASAPAGGE